MGGITDGEIYWEGANGIEGGGMGTAVLQRGPNGWQIMHWHTGSARRPAAAGAEKKN